VTEQVRGGEPLDACSPSQALEVALEQPDAQQRPYAPGRGASAGVRLDDGQGRDVAVRPSRMLGGGAIALSGMSPVASQVALVSNTLRRMLGLDVGWPRWRGGSEEPPNLLAWSRPSLLLSPWSTRPSR
jgi:hypothetical protein